MNSKNILIPLDLMSSPCDALVFARDQAAAGRPLCVTLLYVLNLNIQVPEPKVYQELRMESESALRKLARLFFGTDQAVRVVVRDGIPHDEIVAEAKSQPADLIVLSKPERRTWKHQFRRGTTQKIIDTAPCPVTVLPRAPKVMPPHERERVPAFAEAALAEAV